MYIVVAAAAAILSCQGPTVTTYILGVGDDEVQVITEQRFNLDSRELTDERVTLLRTYKRSACSRVSDKEALKFPVRTVDLICTEFKLLTLYATIKLDELLFRNEIRNSIQMVIAARQLALTYFPPVLYPPL